MCYEEIILEIEGIPLKCKKHELILNSDYFKAMFEGNFIEKNKNIVQIKDVDLKAMNIILTLLWDNTHYIEDDDILMVLQAACMLQFCKIQNICVHKITEILSPKNCLKIWVVTEQLDLKLLYLKAKCMALSEFMLIKETNSIVELTLKQILNYLGSVNLNTDNELSVFQTLMKWWYENGNSFDTSQDLLRLLGCIDFKVLSKNHFKEILTYPDIANTDAGDILKCCYNIINEESIENFTKECKDNAELLTRSRHRIKASFPCILVNSANVQISKKSKLESNEKIVYYDKFKRKRFYRTLDSHNNIRFQVLYFDHRLGKFEKLFNIAQKLEGFKLIGYKEFVFMFGGEFLLGRGEWNYNFWAYDTIKERWSIKSTLAFPRRHFETCILGSKVYITGNSENNTNQELEKKVEPEVNIIDTTKGMIEQVVGLTICLFAGQWSDLYGRKPILWISQAGGIGPFRVNQENLFYYDFVKDKWSKEMCLPVFDRQIKCCDFLNKFFLFSINNSCGYFIDELFNWVKIPVKVENNLFNVQLEFAIFSYNQKLYVKGKTLLELTIVHNQLLVSSVKNITDKEYEKMDITLCNNTVYTLYKYQEEDNYRYSLEKYEMDSDQLGFIFENVSENEVMQANNEEFKLSSTFKLFHFRHYNLVDRNDLINVSF